MPFLNPLVLRSPQTSGHLPYINEMAPVTSEINSVPTSSNLQVEMKDSQNKSDEGSSLADNGGTRRRPYYECTFCKRGFSNAQALGGHMNIHRRDRARERRSPPDSAAVHEVGGYGSSYCNQQHPFGGYPAAMYFPAHGNGGGGGDRENVRQESGSRAAYEMSLFGEELRLGLGAHEDGARTRRIQEVGEAAAQVLDLELRLGHHPLNNLPNHRDTSSC